MWEIYMICKKREEEWWIPVATSGEDNGSGDFFHFVLDGGKYYGKTKMWRQKIGNTDRGLCKF